ncbi:ACT domain-containing protein, partial [Bacillus xiapuensis]|nr:ACT domain-containing protein [Bacillus xiapuensis]
KINQYRIDIKPEEHLLYIKHKDVPGMIGKVGSLLGDYEINIGTMQVGRAAVGGEAIMVLTLDKTLNSNVLQALKLTVGIEEVQLLELENFVPSEPGQVEAQNVESFL